MPHTYLISVSDGAIIRFYGSTMEFIKSSDSRNGDMYLTNMITGSTYRVNDYLTIKEIEATLCYVVAENILVWRLNNGSL